MSTKAILPFENDASETFVMSLQTAEHIEVTLHTSRTYYVLFYLSRRNNDTVLDHYTPISPQRKSALISKMHQIIRFMHMLRTFRKYVWLLRLL